MKINKENTIIFSGVMFTVVALLHLMRVVTKTSFLVGNFEISMWMSVLAIVITAILAVFNLNLIKEKTKLFWLKYVLGLVVFDALFALYFWASDLSIWGISAKSFSFIFVLDVVLVIILSFYINKLLSLSKK